MAELSKSTREQRLEAALERATQRIAEHGWKPDSLLCRMGSHDWTTLPPEHVAAARRAGLNPHPNWYIGPQVPRWCQRCGKQSKEALAIARMAQSKLRTFLEERDLG